MEESVVLPLLENTLRFLSSITTNDDDDDDASNNNNGRVYDDAEVLKGTLVIYGGALLLIIVVFALARRAFPKVYRLRNWVPDTTGDCSTFCAHEQQQGFFAWIGKMYTFRDDEILRKCGMDALCFIRIAKFGYRCKCCCDERYHRFVFGIFGISLLMILPLVLFFIFT